MLWFIENRIFQTDQARFICQNTLDIYLQSDKLLIENLETGNLYGMYIHHIRGEKKKKKNKQLSTSFLEHFQTPSSQLPSLKKGSPASSKDREWRQCKALPSKKAEEIVQADKGRGRQKTCQPWRKN